MSELVTLRDGSSVEIRPIRPEDREALALAYEGVSDDSRYSRFLSVHPELRASELTYLTEIDHHDHEALVALEAGGGPILGVVRYIRIGSDEAEPAMLITDEWQGRGLVSVMLEMLVARAWDEGIRHFRAPVMAGNAASLSSLDRLGRAQHHQVGAEVEVEVALRAPMAEAPPVRRSRAGVRARLTPLTVLSDLAPRRPLEDGARTNTIVVGVGDEEFGRATVEAASDLAEILGASLVLVRARRLQSQDEAEVALEQLAGPARLRGLAVETSVRRTTAAAAIVGACNEAGASMAVLGRTRRGREAAAGGLIGAVADVVTRQAPCNVLLLNSAIDAG